MFRGGGVFSRHGVLETSSGNIALGKCNQRIKIEVWRLKVKITGKENVKIVFRAYLRQKWIDLRQIKTKMIAAFYTQYRRIHFISGTASFCDICL